MLYNADNFARLVRGAKPMPESGKIEGESIIFIPYRDDNDDIVSDSPYTYARRYVVNRDKNDNIFLTYAGITDIGPIFKSTNDLVIGANRIFVDFVPGGIHMWIANEKLVFDCHNNNTIIYVGE